MSVSTEKFAAQMKRVEDINDRVSQQEIRNAQARQAETDKIAKAQERLDEIRADSDRLEAEAAKASQKRQQAIRKELSKIGEEAEKLDDTIRSLQKTAQQNEIERMGALDKLRRKQAATTAQLDKMKSIAGRVGGAFKGLGGLMAGAFSVGAITHFVNKLDDLAKRARDVKMTASQLQELDHQARLAGVSSGALDVSIRSFSKNVGLAAMGTGRAQKALEEMGISLTDANGLTKDQSKLLRETAEYFAKTAGNAENAGLAARLFGEQGVDILRVFESGKDTVNKIFNAKGIDEAAAAAERFKNQLENVQNFGMQAGAKIVEGWSYIIDFATNDIFNGIGDAEYKRAEKRANEEAKRLNAQLAARKKAAEEAERREDEAAEKRLEQIDRANERLRKGREREMSNADKVLNLERRIVDAKKQLEEIDANSDEAVRIYNSLVDDTLSLEKTRAAIKKEEAKVAEAAQKAEKKRTRELQSQSKALQRQLEQQQQAQQRQATARKEFEFETQLQVLRAQGRDDEAKRLEFAKKRNELMDKYGYSIEEATRAQKTLDELQKKGTTEYSDEAKQKAEEIVKRGKGGTIGDKTLKEAQAILEGKRLEGGLQSAMFKEFNAGRNDSFKNINVNTGRMAENVEQQAVEIQNQQAATLANIDQTIKDLKDVADKIKTTVDGIATHENNN